MRSTSDNSIVAIVFASTRSVLVLRRLTPEMAQKYERLFHQPEDFIRLGHRMMVVRVPDEAVCPEESKTTPPKDAGFDR